MSVKIIGGYWQMEESKINVGETYQLESPLLTHPFEGKVMEKLEHSVIVEITQCSHDDMSVSKDLQYKTVINFDNVKEI